MFKLRGSLVTVTRLASTAALGGFLFGYDSSVINGAVTAVGNHYHVGATGLGFTVSSALLGAAVGAVVGGRLADRVGRLMVMRLAAVSFLVSALATGLVSVALQLLADGRTGGRVCCAVVHHPRVGPLPGLAGASTRGEAGPGPRTRRRRSRCQARRDPPDPEQRAAAEPGRRTRPGAG